MNGTGTSGTFACGGDYLGLQIRDARLLRIDRSWVASGIRCARAVATMRRSAGSPWNETGRLSRAMTTSTSSGRISITAAAAASRIQTSKDRSSASRFLACSVCASHRLTAAKRSSARDANRSSAFRSFFGSRSEPSNHQSQTCVSSRTFTETPRIPARRLPTPRVLPSTPRIPEGPPKLWVPPCPLPVAS